MKRLSIRIIGLALIISTCLTLFYGCGSNAKTDTQNSASTGTAAASGSTKPSGPPVELTVEVFDRATPGYQADNNFQTKWIQDNFGTPNNITVKFVPVLRAQEVDKLNVLMAANQAPDISFTYNDSVIYNYVKSGGLTDLGDLLKQNAPNLTAYLGDTLLSYGRFDGKQLAVPAKRVIQGCFAAYIRKDWLDAVGLSVPATTDEWYAAMKAFKEKDPGKLGDKNIPFTFNVDPNNINWTTSMLLESFKEKVTEEQYMTLPNWVIPGFKEGMRYLNKLYNEGIVNPQFTLDKDGKQLEKDVAQGRVGFLIHNYDYPLRVTPGLLSELKKNIPGSDLVPCDPFTNFEGKHPKTMYNPNGLYLIVPKSSKHAAEAIKYLEWMSDPEVLKFLQNGVKGDQYTEEENGIPKNKVPNDQLPDDKKANYIDLAIIANGNEFGSDEKNIEAASFGYPGFEAAFKTAYDISLTDATYTPHFDSVIESQAKYAQTLKDKDSEIFVKSITCKPSDFDKTYDSLVQDYMKAGGQEIVDEKVKLYNAKK